MALYTSIYLLTYLLTKIKSSPAIAREVKTIPSCITWLTRWRERCDRQIQTCRRDPRRNRQVRRVPCKRPCMTHLTTWSWNQIPPSTQTRPDSAIARRLFTLSRQHSGSAKLRQGQNQLAETYCLLVWPWNMLQGHRGWRHWTEHIRLPISVP